MIYITTMRLNSQRYGRGINIYLHQRGAADPQNPWQVVDDPGHKLTEFNQKELQPGINRVEAYLDIFFDEDKYSKKLFDDALAEVEKTIELGTRNPAQIECKVEAGILARVVFSVNMGLEDLTSKRRVFKELRAALKRWEKIHETALANITQQSFQEAV